jgi:hypothetical protein
MRNRFKFSLHRLSLLSPLQRSSRCAYSEVLERVCSAHPGHGASLAAAFGLREPVMLKRESSSGPWASPMRSLSKTGRRPTCNALDGRWFRRRTKLDHIRSSEPTDNGSNGYINRRPVRPVEVASQWFRLSGFRGNVAVPRPLFLTDSAIQVGFKPSSVSLQFCL